MKTRATSTTVALIILLAACGAALPQSQTASIRKAIQAQYDRWEPVGKTLDSKKIETFLEDAWAPSYTAVYLDGRKLNRKGDVDATVQFMKTLKLVRRWSFKIDKISIQDKNKAVVVVTSSFDYKANDAKGKSHRYTGNTTQRDTLVKTSENWLIVNSVQLKSHTLTDGKP